MKKKLRIAMFGHKRWSREGGVEIVVKELCTRMARMGCQVTCYNRSGHHVSGAEYDSTEKTEYQGIRQKIVPTIEKKGANGVDIEAYENGAHGAVKRQDLNIPEDAFVVGMVGRKCKSAAEYKFYLEDGKVSDVLDSEYDRRSRASEFINAGYTHEATKSDLLNMYEKWII